MKYTENNIIGVEFKTPSLNTIYKIIQDESLSDRVYACWGKSSRVGYYKDEVITYFNDGDWIPITQITTQYEIY